MLIILLVINLAFALCAYFLALFPFILLALASSYFQLYLTNYYAGKQVIIPNYTLLVAYPLVSMLFSLIIEPNFTFIIYIIIYTIILTFVIYVHYHRTDGEYKKDNESEFEDDFNTDWGQYDHRIDELSEEYNITSMLDSIDDIKILIKQIELAAFESEEEMLPVQITETIFSEGNVSILQSTLKKMALEKKRLLSISKELTNDKERVEERLQQINEKLKTEKNATHHLLKEKEEYEKYVEDIMNDNIENDRKIQLLNDNLQKADREIEHYKEEAENLKMKIEKQAEELKRANSSMKKSIESRWNTVFPNFTFSNHAIRNLSDFSEKETHLIEQTIVRLYTTDDPKSLSRGLVPYKNKQYEHAGVNTKPVPSRILYLVKNTPHDKVVIEKIYKHNSKFLS